MDFVKKFDPTEKGKYFTAVLYPESMIEGWQDKVAYLIQKPVAYCIHDKDKDGHDGDRKTHVHFIIVYNNNTTLRAALKQFKKLQPSCNYCEICDPKYMYPYLIHDTEDARKAGKYLYDQSERILVNNYDNVMYETLSTQDKLKMCQELADFICDRGLTNMHQLYVTYRFHFGAEYFEIIKTNSTFLSSLCKGVYLDMEDVHKKSSNDAQSC